MLSMLGVGYLETQNPLPNKGAVSALRGVPGTEEVRFGSLFCHRARCTNTWPFFLPISFKTMCQDIVSGHFVRTLCQATLVMEASKRHENPKCLRNTSTKND